MALINEVYSGAVTDDPRLITITIENQNYSGGPVRICTGFFPRTVTLETGQTVQFTGAGIDVKLPKRDTSGNQNLVFQVDNVNGEVARLVDEAEGSESTMTLRTYLLSDLSAPAEPPIKLTVAGVSMQGVSAQITGSYQSPITKAWPRDRYTAQRFSNLRHAS